MQEVQTHSLRLSPGQSTALRFDVPRNRICELQWPPYIAILKEFPWPASGPPVQIDCFADGTGFPLPPPADVRFGYLTVKFRDHLLLNIKAPEVGEPIELGFTVCAYPLQSIRHLFDTNHGKKVTLPSGLQAVADMLSGRGIITTVSEDEDSLCLVFPDGQRVWIVARGDYGHGGYLEAVL